MLKKYLWLLVFLMAIRAQATTDSSHVRISLLTCGSGEQPWETFGHTAIRITDTLAGTDNVYNYGTFNGYDENFLINFTRGKLLYYLSYYPFPHFVEEYAQSGRSIREQELQLSGNDKIALYNFLINNAKDENKYYKYDFFFDNCATRIRDAFERTLGSAFSYAEVLPASSISFRNIINQYFYRVHWQRFGVNLLLGSRIDQPMTNKDIMFLPDYLEKGVAGARLNGKSIVAHQQTILEGSQSLPAGINGPLVLTSVIALFTIISMAIPSWRKVRSVLRFSLLFFTGFLGCFMLVMWWGTDHQSCGNNLNLLWALPTNMVAAFMHHKNKGRYAVVAIALLLLSLLLHLFKVQELPLLELSPLLLSMLLVYGSIYRKTSFHKK